MLIRQSESKTFHRLVAGVVVELSAVVVITNAAVEVLRGALVVESVGIGLGVGKGTAVEVARSKEGSGRGGLFVVALGVTARPSVVVILGGEYCIRDFHGA